MATANRYIRWRFCIPPLGLFMLIPSTIIQPQCLRLLAGSLALFALVAGLVSFSGWVLDIPRFTYWVNAGLSIQPNTTLLISLAGAALLLLQLGYGRVTLVLGVPVFVGGALSLLQYIFDADFGINHQLLFDRQWGAGGTVSPGRFGPPASIAFILIGISLVLLGMRNSELHRHAPRLALVVVLFMMFSLLGYLFGARNFFALPGLSAISLPTAIMLMALALGLIVSVPQHHPMLLLCERSGAGTMARIILPIVVVMIPLFMWLRYTGYSLGFYDLGTSRALGAAMLMLGVVALMWVALLALRRREQREREADRRKDEFLATLAHELRNPLAPISNATAILKLAHSSPTMVTRATEIIERQMSHMVRLVDDLLDVSRIRSGKMEIRRERIELAAVIHQAREICQPMAEAANQQVNLELPAYPIYLDADPVRLAQVVSNLLNNASKFAPQHTRISVKVAWDGKDVEISVKDEGIGIPADKLQMVFEMFTQVDQSLERSHGGLGIGLTLAKRLIELHGGSIQARSDGLGKGTEMIIRLPVSIDQVPPSVAPVETRAPMRNRILIVDDNLDSARTLAEVLTLSGNETLLAHDGEAAVLAAEQHRPNAILLDIGLPKLNGFDACRRIRENSWAVDIRIIALTGWGQGEDRRKSTEAGFDGHLVKPVDLTQLLGLLEDLPNRAATISD